MNELITQYTALPNLHPALVHFPIALLPMAVLLDALLLRWKSQREWLDRAASLLYAAAALGAGVAYWAGRQAADTLPPLATHIQAHVNEHSDSAYWALWLLGFVAAFRVAIAFLDTQGRRQALRAFLVVLAIAAVGLVYRTADLGGGLVFQHGIGVAESDDHGAAQASEGKGKPGVGVAGAGEVEGRLLKADDGSLAWKPLPGDAAALGTVLQVAPETGSESVSWAEAVDGSAGLGLSVDGEAILLLPGVFGDVQVQARLDVDEFEGEVGLAHHVLSGSRASLLTVSFPGHEFVLATRDGEVTRQLHEAVSDVPEGPFQLTVTAMGRHVNGFLGETKVVHGHEPAPADGGCGLFLNGRGTVSILAMTVKPGGS